MKSMTEQAGRYLATLDEIRVRLDVVRSVCKGMLSTGSEQFDYEIVAIHLRKILEHIAFGSLTANRTAYEAAHTDIQKVWKAKNILDKLERFHKDFYPRALQRPSTFHGQGKRHLHFEFLTDGFLTRTEFVELYDACSQVIHSQNPFSAVSSIQFGCTPLEWAERIRLLLSFHLFRLAGHPEIWLGELQGPDGKAHVSIAAPN